MVLTDPFDYVAEDALIDSWSAARASVRVPQFAVQPSPGVPFSRPSSHCSGDTTKPSPQVSVVHVPDRQIFCVPHGVPFASITAPVHF